MNDLFIMSTRVLDGDRRFWNKVDIKGPEDCWNWLGVISRGHGQVRRDTVLMYAHRYSYMLCRGQITEDRQCLHKCNNGKCVNPNHLYLGNDGDNTTDKIAHNRMALLPEAPRFSMAEILEIRRLVKSGISQQRIASEFHCCQMTISNYIRNSQYCKEGTLV